MHQNRKVYTDRNKVFDQYYTKKKVVKQCLNIVKRLPYSYDLIIEPSAGDGAFYDSIEGNKIGIDIDSNHKEIIKQDWLDYKISDKYKTVLVIGNPPFGRYSKLSTLFIKHSLSFSNVQTIAFILPNVFRKHTRQKILPDNWRIRSITELGKDSFVFDGEDYHLPASFFVFDKSEGKDLRVNHNLYTETKDFTFGSKDDFDIFVFGASPTKVIKNPQPNNRGYYLKSKIPVDKLSRKIKNTKWTGNSCANGGVYWLTKYEFLKQYINYHEPETSRL